MTANSPANEYAGYASNLVAPILREITGNKAIDVVPVNDLPGAFMGWVVDTAKNQKPLATVTMYNHSADKLHHFQITRMDGSNSDRSSLVKTYGYAADSVPDSHRFTMPIRIEDSVTDAGREGAFRFMTQAL